MINIREKQVNTLLKLMHIEKESGPSVNFADQWKILIYDDDCRDIISPLLNVGALRQKGVTLHLTLHSDREPVTDAPAVYFVRPTEENLKRIAEDCAKRMYRTIYLHFVTRIERQLLEKFAQDLVALNAVSVVSKVYDQYLDFISLEPQLFTLNIKNSFVAYNDPTLSENDIRGFMGRISSGLVSMVRVLGSLPIIRASPGGAAEMLAQEFCTTLRENISPRGPAHALFADCVVGEKNRPLMIILDRTSDMTPPLLHASTYQALVDDLLEHRLNRVTVAVSSSNNAAESAQTGKKKTYDLNTQADNFYGRFASAAFPDAVEANEKELAEVSQRENEIRSGRPPAAAASSAASASVLAQLEDSGKDLKDAIESLPELAARKKVLETHTNILQAVMKCIASREVPTYFELEQAIVAAGRVPDKASAIALLKDGTKGALVDKARLLALVSVTLGAEAGAAVGGGSSAGAQLSLKTQYEEYDAAFNHGCAALAVTPASADVSQALSAVAFLRKMLSLQSSMSMSSIMSGGAGGIGGNAYLTSFLSSAQSKASSLMAKAASLFTKFSPLYITRVVDNLAEGRACPEDDSFCLLDPRLKAGEVPGPEARSGQKYSEVIVFVIGGGCYSEYFNLQECVKQKSGSAVGSSSLRTIMYGCSELINGDNFLAQLAYLGRGSIPAAGGASSSQ